MEINKKSIQKGKKDDEIGLKISGIRKNDEIYIIKK